MSPRSSGTVLTLRLRLSRWELRKCTSFDLGCVNVFDWIGEIVFGILSSMGPKIRLGRRREKAGPSPASDSNAEVDSADQANE
jgi:hypothetical protein